MTTVFFLPGMMCDRQLWEAVWTRLPQAWDIRYIPMETAPSREGIMAMIGGHLAEAPAHVVGFSMGGYAALEYAIGHPDAYRSLTMVGASAYGLPKEERERREKYLPMLEKAGYTGISRHRLAQFVHPSRMEDPEVAGVVRQMDARLGKQTLIRQITSASLRESSMDDLPKLDFPVQVIGAEQDAVIKPWSLEKMVARLPQGKLHLLPETGHMIPLERPEETAALLTRFVEGLS